MENFQVDVILNSLQDLKQVRDKNEKQLAVEHGRRVELEGRLDSVTARHTMTSVRKTQSAEALKVATEQASLAEAQANGLELRCREKRDEVKALNDKMEDLRRQEEQALSDFSLKMSELADKFRRARAYYAEPQLASEEEECDKNTEECRKRVLLKEAILTQLKSEFQSHSTGSERDNSSMEHSGHGVTRGTWQTLYDMMVEERGVAKTALQREEGTLRSLQIQQITRDHTAQFEGRDSVTGREE